jgi:predicted phosphate transport protein (TIGR00153 family)
MKKKTKSNYYFDSFPTLAHFSVECGMMILDFMKNYDYNKLEELKNSVHEIEHKADEHKHEVTEKLLTEFMTPIDREDIYELLRLIDEVTDAIEEISLKLYLYNYKELPPNTIPFTEITVKCIQETETCLKNVKDYQNFDTFRPLVREVIKLEEESDAIYIENVHNLYISETDALKIHKFETIYELLEEVSDRCREVCRYVQNIAFKNM